MPSLQVMIDDQVLAMAATEGLDVAAVHLSGSLSDECLAELRADGGTHAEDRPFAYDVWIDATPIRAGQRLAVTLCDSNGYPLPLRSIQRMEHPGDISPPKSFQWLRTRPLKRAPCGFVVATSTGEHLKCAMRPKDNGFAFHVLWNAFQPDRVRVSLHTYTLDGLKSRMPSHYLFKQYLSLGQSVEIELVSDEIN